jgi:hypothetical protein
MNTCQLAPGTAIETGRRSQNELVLERLRRTPGQWVAMPALVEVSGSYVVHSRVADLRKAGWPIEQKNERAGRQIHSFYRYAEPNTPTA